MQSGNELFGRLLGRLLRGLTELPLATRNAPSNAEDGALRLSPKPHRNSTGGATPKSTHCATDSCWCSACARPAGRVRATPVRSAWTLPGARPEAPSRRPQEPDRRRIALAEGSGACAGALASPLSAPRRVGSPRLGSRAGRCSQVRTAPLGRHTFQCCERK